MTQHKIVDGRLRLYNVRIQDAGEYRCSPKIVSLSNQQPGKIDLTVIENKQIDTQTKLKSEKILRKPGEQAEQVCTGKSSGVEFAGSIIIDWYNSNGQVR